MTVLLRPAGIAAFWMELNIYRYRCFCTSHEALWTANLTALSVFTLVPPLLSNCKFYKRVQVLAWRESLMCVSVARQLIPPCAFTTQTDEVKSASGWCAKKWIKVISAASHTPSLFISQLSDGNSRSLFKTTENTTIVAVFSVITPKLKLQFELQKVYRFPHSQWHDPARPVFYANIVSHR